MKKTARKPASNENARKPHWAFKLGVAFAVLGALGGVVYVALTSSVFSIREYEFRGNKYLSDRELMGVMAVTGGENIFSTSSARLAGVLQGSPWVRKVSVRKEFPHKMVFLVDESAPQAVLEDNGSSYIVDAQGKVLQKLSGRPTVVLPVIIGSKDANARGYLKAVELAGVLRDDGVGKESGGVEITGMERGAHELTIKLDGVRIKIGEDRFREKLAAFDELKDKITGLEIAVDYVDLRFADRVIVRHVAAADATGVAAVEKKR